MTRKAQLEDGKIGITSREEKNESMVNISLKDKLDSLESSVNNTIKTSERLFLLIALAVYFDFPRSVSLQSSSRAEVIKSSISSKQKDVFGEVFCNSTTEFVAARCSEGTTAALLLLRLFQLSS